jgi:plasmid stabilization system protein ParE
VKVALSLLAEADVEAIATHVGRDGPRAARRLADALYAAAEGLLPFPERFALAAGVEDLGVRRRPVGDYSIFFVIRPEDVLVLRVAHGARDYPRLFPDV